MNNKEDLKRINNSIVERISTLNNLVKDNDTVKINVIKESEKELKHLNELFNAINKLSLYYLESSLKIKNNK
jgi:hypothetical protein